jgi:UDP-N-acetylmuramate--alanine ligase
MVRPEAAVLTNVELDHHSHYLHIEDVERVFREFLSRLPENGLLIHYAGDLRVGALAKEAPCRACSYGFDPAAAYQAREIVVEHPGSSFEIWSRERKVASARLQVPGKHNVLNALACFAALTELGVDQEPVLAALSSFTGAVRRFQLKGERGGVTVVDDYAHHPTELQPHLYSRTEYLHAEFAEALAEADIAVVTDVYGAREDPWPGVTGKLIVDSLLKLATNKPVVYLPRLGAVVDYLQRLAGPGDLVLTLGAGDVHRVGERYLNVV